VAVDEGLGKADVARFFSAALQAVPVEQPQRGARLVAWLPKCACEPSGSCTSSAADAQARSSGTPRGRRPGLPRAARRRMVVLFIGSWVRGWSAE
jgi:hypothetical protein